MSDPLDPNTPQPTVPPVSADQSQSTIPVTPAVEPAQPSAPVQPATPAPVQSAAPTPSTPIDEGSVVEKATKAIAEKLGKALGLTKEEAQEQIPTDPKALSEYIKTHAKQGAQEMLDAQKKAADDQLEAQRQQINQGAARFQQLWKDQYSQLAESGKVPRIANPADKNDPGNVIRLRLLTKLSQVIQENQSKGVDYVPTLKEIFYEFPDVMTTTTVAGGDAPISGGGRTIAGGGQMTYEQLHSTPIEALVKANHQ